MSLEVDGVWKSGVWATTVWAEGVWREGAYVQLEVEESFTGGFGTQAWKRYRDDEEKRRQRVAMGIIPDDLPPESAEAITEAAEKRIAALAKRELAEKAEAEDLERLNRILEEVIAAQEAAEAEYRLQQLEALRERYREVSDAADVLTRNNRNAEAVLVMLSLAQN